MVRKKLSTRVPSVGQAYLERAVGGAAQVLLHEVDALSGHWAEVRERIAVAREARGIGDLVRTQVDLLPETRARLVLDQRERLALLRSWLVDLRYSSSRFLP